MAITRNEESMIMQIKDIIKRLKKFPFEGNYIQTAENYIFDDEIDVRITVEIKPKLSNYDRGIEMFHGYYKSKK